MANRFPLEAWEKRTPEEAGFDSEKLNAVEAWLQAQPSSYRLVLVRNGYLVAEWGQDIAMDKELGQASASKSYFSCLLGIAVAEGKLPSAAAKVIDYYPEMMQVGQDEGPKPGRWAFEKDSEITFHQLICNTSGYMKPGEEPGKVFHYQTYGMNILTNALATIYGYYDSRDPERLPGCAQLIAEKLRDPIGGTWSHSYTDFEHPPGAKKNIFGHSLRVCATALETARAGHLWLNWGNWDGTQVVPSEYLRQATVTNGDIRANEPEDKWCYGHGFWVNDFGVQWPDLPRDSFAASGAGAKHIWVCPSLDLVVVQNPGPWNRLPDEHQKKGAQNEILRRILSALEKN